MFNRVPLFEYRPHLRKFLMCGMGEGSSPKGMAIRKRGLATPIEFIRDFLTIEGES